MPQCYSTTKKRASFCSQALPSFVSHLSSRIKNPLGQVKWKYSCKKNSKKTNQRPQNLVFLEDEFRGGCFTFAICWISVGDLQYMLPIINSFFKNNNNDQLKWWEDSKRFKEAWEPTVLDKNRSYPVTDLSGFRTDCIHILMRLGLIYRLWSRGNDNLVQHPSLGQHPGSTSIIHGLTEWIPWITTWVPKAVGMASFSQIALDPPVALLHQSRSVAILVPAFFIILRAEAN